MSPDEDAFLKAISDNSADEATRLVYADWLAERDDPRAAFARLSGEFLRCVRGLADLRRAYSIEWLEVMDPLFNRFRTFSLPPLGANPEATLTDVFVSPGSPVDVGQRIFTVLSNGTRQVLYSEQPGLITSVLVRVDERIATNQPMLTYLSGQEKFGLRTPRGPMVAFIHMLENRRQSLRATSRELNEAMLARHRTALVMVFGERAVEDAERIAADKYGWWSPTHSLQTLLKESQLTPDQQIQERIDIHIETLHVLLRAHGQPDSLREFPELPGTPEPSE